MVRLLPTMDPRLARSTGLVDKLVDEMGLQTDLEWNHCRTRT